MAKAPTQSTPQQGGSTAPSQQQQGQSSAPMQQQGSQTVFRDWASI